LDAYFVGDQVYALRAEVIIDYSLAAQPVQRAGWFAELLGLKTPTTAGIALGHELLGHGMQAQLGHWNGAHFVHRGTQEDAVRYENRFLRAPRGLPPRTVSGQ
jgi:hypothetical protein